MPSPESFTSNSETNAEALRAEYQARGHEVNQEVAKRREALLKRKAELEAKLKAAGVNIEEAKAQSQPESEPENKSKSGSYFDALGYTEPTPEPKVERVESTPAEVAEKSRNNPQYKRFITEAVILSAAALTAAGIMIGAAFKNAKEDKTPTPDVISITTEATPTVSDNIIDEDSVSDNAIENTKYAGETPDGVRYDYEEYADRDNKVSFNAYGYDYSEQYNDREKATEGILGMAEKEPEALASYAYNIFTDEEKEELGIKGLTMVQIDEKFDQAGGGDLQKKLLEKFAGILNDEEKTSFKFYKQNGTEETNYIYFTDDNNDGNFTPNELHLSYDTKKRNKAPQVDVYRTITNKDGKEKTVKMLDLNMECGYQPNYEKAPAGVPKVSADPQVVKPVSKQTASKTTTKKSNPQPKTPTPEIVTPYIPTPIIPVPPVAPEPEPYIPTPTPTPTPEIQPKDGDNLKRIDDQINKDIAEDIGTQKIVIPPNPGVSNEDITEKPSSEDYEGTAPVIQQNEESKKAEEVQPTQPENNYSEDKGPANEGYKPVQENEAGQKEADQKEIPQESAPTGGQELDDALADLGIF